MCCATLTAQGITMATTQLMREACCVVCWPQKGRPETSNRPLCMNWVVVTDANGNRRLQMGWAPSAEPLTCAPPGCNVPVTRFA